MKKSYVIRVCSTKGGVGKTTVAINLATALQLRGYNVLLIDSDSINPCVGLYMGLQDVNTGIFDVIKGRIDIKRAIIPHPVTGLHVLPGNAGYEGNAYTKIQISRFFSKLRSGDYDFIVVDTQPGIIFQDNFRNYEEGLIVVWPFEASCLSALKMSRQYTRGDLKTSIVVNMVRGKRYELSLREIEELSEAHVIAVLPEDEKVAVNTAEHIPVYIYDKRTKFSRSIAELADVYTSRVAIESERHVYKRWDIFSFFRGNKA